MRFHVKPPLATLLLGTALALPAGAAGEAVRYPGPGLELQGRLFRPSGDGPFPAIVLLHGCSGMWRRDGKEPAAGIATWAEHWRQQGYVALLVDSFGSRGEREVCTQRIRTILPHRERPRDARASLAWLAARTDVDPERVHLMGFSHGGATVLNTIHGDAPGRSGAGPRFRSAVAFYPGCAAVLQRPVYATTVPLLIQSGEADDWTPARHCEALVEKYRGQGASLEIDVYPDAHHGFDIDIAVRFRPEVRNVSSDSGWGATVGGHPEARARAVARTTRWVAARNR